MDNESIAEQLVKSLSFEIEAIPQDNTVQIKSSGNVAPVNLKIKVRNKDQQGNLQHGVIKMPKIECNSKNMDRIRLVSSDQTIMSFNVLMEADFEKPQKKPRRNFFGGCFGTECDDDYAYTLSKKPSNSSKSESGIVMKLNSEGPSNPKEKKLFGKCKPGGCLDPPFGEEKYAYELKLDNQNQDSILTIQKVKQKLKSDKETTKNENRDKRNSFFKWKKSSVDSSQDSNKENETLASSLVERKSKTSSTLIINVSDHLITYPATSSSSTNLEYNKKNKLNIDKNRISTENKIITNSDIKSPANITSATRLSIQDSYYFVPHKKEIKLNDEKGNMNTDRTKLHDNQNILRTKESRDMDMESQNSNIMQASEKSKIIIGDPKIPNKVSKLEAHTGSHLKEILTDNKTPEELVKNMTETELDPTTEKPIHDTKGSLYSEKSILAISVMKNSIKGSISIEADSALSDTLPLKLGDDHLSNNKLLKSMTTPIIPLPVVIKSNVHDSNNSDSKSENKEKPGEQDLQLTGIGSIKTDIIPVSYETNASLSDHDIEGDVLQSNNIGDNERLNELPNILRENYKSSPSNNCNLVLEIDEIPNVITPKKSCSLQQDSTVEVSDSDQRLGENVEKKPVKESLPVPTSGVLKKSPFVISDKTDVLDGNTITLDERKISQLNDLTILRTNEEADKKLENNIQLVEDVAQIDQTVSEIIPISYINEDSDASLDVFNPVELSKLSKPEDQSNLSLDLETNPNKFPEVFEDSPSFTKIILSKDNKNETQLSRDYKPPYDSETHYASADVQDEIIPNDVNNIEKLKSVTSSSTCATVIPEKSTVNKNEDKSILSFGSDKPFENSLLNKDVDEIPPVDALIESNANNVPDTNKSIQEDISTTKNILNDSSDIKLIETTLDDSSTFSMAQYQVKLDSYIDIPSDSETKLNSETQNLIVDNELTKPSLNINNITPNQLSHDKSNEEYFAERALSIDPKISEATTKRSISHILDMNSINTRFDGIADDLSTNKSVSDDYGNTNETKDYKPNETVSNNYENTKDDFQDEIHSVTTMGDIKSFKDINSNNNKGDVEILSHRESQIDHELNDVKAQLTTKSEPTRDQQNTMLTDLIERHSSEYSLKTKQFTDNIPSFRNSYEKIEEMIMQKNSVQKTAIDIVDERETLSGSTDKLPETINGGQHHEITYYSPIPKESLTDKKIPEASITATDKLITKETKSIERDKSTEYKSHLNGNIDLTELARLSPKKSKSLQDVNKDVKSITAGPDLPHHRKFPRTTIVADASIDIESDIILDVAMKKLKNSKDQLVLKTLDSVNCADGNINEVIIVNTKIKPNNEPLTIPIDSKNILYLHIKRTEHDNIITKTMIEYSDAELKQIASKTLATLYEEQLIPLRNTIKNLKVEIDSLAEQQIQFKDKLQSAKKHKIRPMHSHKRCGCLKK